MALKYRSGIITFFGQTFHCSNFVVYPTVTRGDFYVAVGYDFQPYVLHVYRWCEDRSLPSVFSDAALPYFSVSDLTRLLDVFDNEG